MRSKKKGAGKFRPPKLELRPAGSQISTTLRPALVNVLHGRAVDILRDKTAATLLVVVFPSSCATHEVEVGVGQVTDFGGAHFSAPLM